MTSTGHVFISHSSDNRELASELAAFLEARGIKVWIAPRDVRPGMDYSEQLQLAIENAIAFVVLVTEMANKSPYVRAETEMAFSTHKPIFPVRLADIQPAAGLAFFLKIRHWTDAYGSARSDNLDRLARELQTLTRRMRAAGPAGNARNAAPAPAAAAPPRADTCRPVRPPLGVTAAASPAASPAGAAGGARHARGRGEMAGGGRSQGRPLSRALEGHGGAPDHLPLELGGLPRQPVLVRLPQDVGAGGGDGLPLSAQHRLRRQSRRPPASPA